MSEGCVVCGEKTKDRDFQIALLKANEYAKEKQIPVAIYKEAGEWKFLNAFEAARIGIPIFDVVSFYNYPASV